MPEPPLQLDLGLVQDPAELTEVDLSVVHPSWIPVLEGLSVDLAAIDARLRADVAAGIEVLPRREHRLRALATPVDAVRVLVVGQDPYPTPGHAVGLSFSVAPGVRPLPGSLRNILRELRDDVGVGAVDGDLSPWAAQGVLLLNRVLTVAAGTSGSHRRIGWERVTDRVVDTLAARGTPPVSLLWGLDAQALAPRLDAAATVTGVHPSPLSASRGFFGSRPFSAVDAALAARGAPPVDWSLGPAATPSTTGPATTGPRAPR